MDASAEDLRLHIYGEIVATGVAPTPAEAAGALGRLEQDVAGTYRALADAHVLVLQPGTTDIWMAMPFSNVPTAYSVVADGRAYYANCAWDAFGIAAALRTDARILTRCADCGEPLAYRIRNGVVKGSTGVVHVALAARRWWDDIGYT